MKTIINIQSVSDLITNSSTEVFVVYDKGNIADIKNLVNSILSLLDPSKTFDDYFTIKMSINYEDLFWIFDKYFTVEIICNEYCWQTYEERPEDESDLSYEDWCFKHCEDWNDYDGVPAIENIKIVAKNPEDEKAARLINSIPYIFESESRYC